MPVRVLTPDVLVWETRPHAPGEPARHTASVCRATSSREVPANLWRYEPGARGRRHVHADQAETFVVLSGVLTMYVGEPPERVEVPAGGVLSVPGGTPLQSVNHGEGDLLLYAYGFPPDTGATVLD